MIVSKRLIAFVIDMGLAIFSGAFITGGLWILMNASIDFVNVNLADLAESYESIIRSEAIVLSIFFFWVIGWPSILWGFTTYKFRKTLGKVLLKLQVVNRDGNNLTFGQALGRELLKVIPTMIPPLWIIPLLQAILTETTYYDQIFGSRVVAKMKSTAVQENFTQYYNKT